MRAIHKPGLRGRWLVIPGEDTLDIQAVRCKGGWLVYACKGEEILYFDVMED